MNDYETVDIIKDYLPKFIGEGDMEVDNLQNYILL